MDFLVGLLLLAIKCILATEMVKKLLEKDLISREFQVKAFVFFCGFMLTDAMIKAPVELYFIYRYENRQTINFMPLCLYFSIFTCPILLAIGYHGFIKWWLGANYELYRMIDDIMFGNMWNFGNRNPARRQQQMPAPAA